MRCRVYGSLGVSKRNEGPGDVGEEKIVERRGRTKRMRSGRRFVMADMAL